MGTWGLNLWQNQIYLSYICAVVPFGSNWGGIKILAFNSCTVGTDELTADDIFIFPIPARDKIIVESSLELNFRDIKIQNALGQNVPSSFTKNGRKSEVNISNLGSGVYFLKINFDDREIIKKFVK
jgi:hypothetical protein